MSRKAGEGWICLLLAAQLAVKPDPGGCPFPLHCTEGDAQQLGDLLEGEAGEEPQLDEVCLLRVELGEPGKSFVQSDHIEVSRLGKIEDLVQGDLDSPLPPLLRPASLGVVREDPPHEKGCNAEKLLPVLPLDDPLTLEATIKLADQSGWLEGMVGSFPLKVAPGHLPQVVEDHGHELLESFRVARTPLLKKLGDLGGRRGHGGPRLYQRGRSPLVTVRHIFSRVQALAGQS
jgi:hypothetical protein